MLITCLFIIRPFPTSLFITPPPPPPPPSQYNSNFLRFTYADICCTGLIFFRISLLFPKKGPTVYLICSHLPPLYKIRRFVYLAYVTRSWNCDLLNTVYLIGNNITYVVNVYSFRMRYFDILAYNEVRNKNWLLPTNFLKSGFLARTNDYQVWIFS